MSISGSLVDASVPEIVQFIYLGRSTGMLVLSRDDEVARLGFHQGDIINASSDGLPRLGDLLVQRGLVSRETVEELVGLQVEENNWLNLGSLLVERQLISLDTLHEILTDLTRRTIFSLLSWETGSFQFTRCVPIGFQTLEQIDESLRLNQLKVRTEGVLLEAAHCLDEANRRADGLGPPGSVELQPFADATIHDPGREEPVLTNTDDIGFELMGRELERALSEIIPASPVDGMSLPPLDEGLLILTRDDEFRADVLAAIGRDQQLHSAIREGIESWAIVDLREAGPRPGAMAALMPDFPVSGTVGIVSGIRRAAEAYSAGVTLATSVELDDILACLRSLTLSSEAPSRRPNKAVTTALERLRNVMREMQGHEDEPNVTLNLMNLVGEVVERAILLTVIADVLRPIGAFGFSTDRQPLAIATTRLELPLDGAGALGSTIEDGMVRHVSFSNAQLPEALAKLLGKPVYDRVILLPVRGLGKVLGVVYADNGSIPTRIEQVDILEIACGQVGVALENQLLRNELNEARAL